jgi:anti-sigma B factor antagonist
VKISPRRLDQTTVLDIVGDIDLAHSTELRRVVLHELCEARTLKVVLNMLEVEYMDSSGVASLIEGLKASREMGARFVLFGLTPIVQEVLQISRLLKVFEIYDTEDKALSS